MEATTTPKPTRPETLVAIDWKAEGLSLDRVLAFVGDALIGVETGTQAHWQTGAEQTVHRVTFDARRVRNTEVHGKSYHSGFVSHIE